MKLKCTFTCSLFLLFAFLLVGCHNSANKNKEVDNVLKHNVVAYVAGYRNFDFSTIDVSKLTHINYAFVNIRNGEVVFDTTKIDGKVLTVNDLNTLVGLKAANPRLQILASVGGWTWSGGFSDAASTEEARIKFASSCARFVHEHSLDGIDLDWEYPNQIGAGNTFKLDDVHNFTLMLKSVREALDRKAKEGGNAKHYLLTIATGADKTYVDNTELGDLQQYVDFINIMTYDFYNGLHKVTGHHSNFRPSANPDLDMNSVVNAVDLHLKAGVPAGKLNLGIPLYGRKWEGVKPSGDKVLFQEAETVGMGIDFVDFAGDINQNGFARYWDETAEAPYLWNAEKKIFISYEDEMSIRNKLEYLKTKGLGGVMFWEYCADYDSRLRNAIAAGLAE